MDRLKLTETVERYLIGDLTGEELAVFEELRKSDPVVEQLVAEQIAFMKEMESFGERKRLKNMLSNVHGSLVSEGLISGSNAPKQGKLVQLAGKYRKTISVAASIAGITALVISGLVVSFAPASKKSEVQYLNLVNELNRTKQQISKLDSEFKEKENSIALTPSKRDGTGFLIDGKGFIITNAHVVKASDSVYVENNKGEYFKAAVVYSSDSIDVAILKICDKRFQPIKHLPYGIKKQSSELGEEVFTLGYPRKEIVYGKGYLSANTGYRGDTVTYQIAISANPGNSGAPLFNNNGEIVGILSGKQITAEGVVFAIKEKNIFRAVEALKKDSAELSIRLPGYSSVKGIDRVNQVQRIKECIFVVKSY
ncbi:MAG TPA: serine protease [Parasegetibacter sp.]|jgi:serine protease Do